MNKLLMNGSAIVQTEGADIAYDWEGLGPMLLMIAGGGGSAGRYAPISALLKNEFTVVRYDRRCNSRSTGDCGKDMDIAQQARDAVAVIRAIGADRAYIFGNSGGAAIALKIAEQYPEVVCGIIAHEPPVVPVLPDAEETLRFFDRVQDVMAKDGVVPAARLFVSVIAGFDDEPFDEGHRIGDAEVDQNLTFMMQHEFRQFSLYKPDLDRIRENRVPMIVVGGRASGDKFYVRAGKVVAEIVGCPYQEISGHHIAFLSDPESFVTELKPILAQLRVGPNVHPAPHN